MVRAQLLTKTHTKSTLPARALAAVSRRVKSVLMLPIERYSNIVRVPPCYQVYAPSLGPQSVVLDCGTGHDANFSMAMIRRFGTTCFGLEPTRRYHKHLRALSEDHPNRFRHFDYAIAARQGTAIFNEVLGRESGSLSHDHTNVLSYPSIRYTVETVGLADIFNLLGVRFIDLIKLDVEGAEYEFFDAADTEWVKRVGQFVVEFHHHCIPRYTTQENTRIVNFLSAVGFTSYSLDGINYLFYQSGPLVARVTGSPSDLGKAGV